MSQIMKALAQSEQSHQANFANNRNVEKGAKKASRKPSLVWLTIIILLPVTLFLVFHVYMVQRDWQDKRVQLLAEQQVIDAQVAQPSEPLAKILTYPEIGPLTPLVKVNKQSDQVAVKQSAAIESYSPPVKTEQVQLVANKTQDDLQLDSLDLSELSPELAQIVQNALLEDTSNVASDDNESRAIIKLVDNENQYSGRLPAMNLQTHMYASSTAQRWVKVNGKELYEGDRLDDQVKLMTISPRVIVIEYKNELIEVPALYDWNG